MRYGCWQPEKSLTFFPLTLSKAYSGKSGILINICKLSIWKARLDYRRPCIRKKKKKPYTNTKTDTGQSISVASTQVQISWLQIFVPSLPRSKNLDGKHQLLHSQPPNPPCPWWRHTTTQSTKPSLQNHNPPTLNYWIYCTGHLNQLILVAC